jgi:methylase of polypeptide subunit release factors
MGTGSTAEQRALIKARGGHYTPPELATFLADAILERLRQPAASMRVLDPACGDGSLLFAFATAVRPDLRRHLHLVGFDTHARAIEEARTALGRLDVASVDLRVGDFLLETGPTDPSQRRLALELDGRVPATLDDGFDAVIANPPYVRTQVLGTERARHLAQRYALSGRVDLYHAFLKAIALALREGGVLGLLTSNRFLVTQAGAAMRESLQHDFDLLQVIDLGDTKLFSAAVLPAIAIARRRATTRPELLTVFTRVYEVRGSTNPEGAKVFSSILDALRNAETGLVQVGDLHFNIERGDLKRTADSSQPWALSSQATDLRIQSIAVHTGCRFGDVAKIRVGIKTTADPVFIRSDWDTLPPGTRPEEELLRPLLTHRLVARWRAHSGSALRILYPHAMSGGRRVPVNLDDYPCARGYLESHRERLSSRKYVIEAGRRWYEIWVPQQPTDWASPKIVFPDISETPRFFLDDQGALVNGDCYWITLLPGKSESWLFLMLAVANSSFMEQYYDTMFNNKLYAGRRRFLTQYVERFPLPAPDSPCARQVITLVRQRLAIGPTKRRAREIWKPGWTGWSGNYSASSKKPTGSGIWSFLFRTRPSNLRKNRKNSSPVVSTKWSRRTPRSALAA